MKQIVSALAVAILLSATRVLAEQQIIRDAEFRTIGYLERSGNRTVVKDCNYRLLGYADDHGTYDSAFKKVYSTFAPELLLADSPCRKKPTTPPRR